MTGKDFVVLPAHALPRFNAPNMPPGKSKNAKSVTKDFAAPEPNGKPRAKSPSLAGKGRPVQPPIRESAPKAESIRAVVKKKQPTASPTSASSPLITAGGATNPNALRDEKQVVRREMRESLAKMRGRADRSAKICKAILANASWRRATIVAIFAPMVIEPDIEMLWKHVEGRTICYPTIRMGKLEFIRVTGPKEAVVGQFGIREPAFNPARVIPAHTFDLILVPGAAFTADGERLGRGGGFYDRLLSTPEFRAFKVGVCFQRQVRESLPIEPHDQRVHRVVTESGFLQRPELVRAGKPAA